MESDMVEVEVEFDYEAELSDELTIKAGEVIKDVKKMDGGWWEGTLNGRRGVFPDNFVKVINRDTPKTKPLTAPPPVSAIPANSGNTGNTEEPVQLRRGQQSRASGNNNKKKCRVLFSYQPQHEDELELKLEDVVDFITEVEDGWWKGKLRGRVGVFPSNFVEMVKHASNDDEQTVADKNKRNEKLKSVERTQRPPSKISSLIQDAENKSKKSSKSSMENLSLVKRESPLGGEDNSTAKSDDLSNAPKLPPKPVKEQCVVLFPYNAVNDDELSLEEGQIITIVSKDVEDKGWWKGEIDGKVGVFPDNFVKLVNPTSTNTTTTTEDAKPKKAAKTTGAKIASQLKSKKSDIENNSANSSREKLNGSSDKIFKKSATPLKKDTKQPVSLPPTNLAENKASPKKHSFGKSTPPPKPKPPSLTSKGSTGSLNKEPIKEESEKPAKPSEKPAKPTEKPSKPSKEPKTSTLEKVSKEVKSEKSNMEPSKELDLDTVLRTDNKLEHLTAERVKAPKRRPPSSQFQKDAKLSGDAFESFEVTNTAPIETEAENPELKHKRSASQGSLHGNDNHESNLLSATRQESKNRLSFKMVKTSLKEALGNLNPTNGDKNVSRESLRKSSEPKPEVPKPEVPKPEVSKEDSDTAKKPDWLAELSRKQANRRSAVFPSNESDSNSVKMGSSPPKIAETKPVVAPDKPHIPLKPSQIREEARKSAVFPKRSSTEGQNQGHSNNNNDKENNKPVVSTAKPVNRFPSQEFDKPSKIIQEPPKSPKPKIPNLDDKPKLPVNIEPEVPVKPVSSPPIIGWKPLSNQSSVSSITSPVSEENKIEKIIRRQSTEEKIVEKPRKLSVSTEENKIEKLEKLSLEERVKRLEDTISSLTTNFEAKFESLSKELEAERLLNRKLQDELKKINH